MQLTKTLVRTPAPLLALRFARLEIGGALRRAARMLGINRPRELTLDQLQIPDSVFTRAATALVTGIESPMLVNHSLRTYLFGAAIGRHLEMTFDAELLYLGAILHDVGLTPAYEGEGSFEINGARAAHEFLTAQRMEAGRADMVHEAIALHAAVGVADRRAPEIALLHYGAGMDVIGFRAEDIDGRTRAAIVEHYPRLHFKREFPPLIADQAARKPECNIAGHVALGIEARIRTAPFVE